MLSRGICRVDIRGTESSQSHSVGEPLAFSLILEPQVLPSLRGTYPETHVSLFDHDQRQVEETHSQL
jgi:hypothetical protein